MEAKPKHCAPGLAGGIYRPLGDRDADRIINESFRLLEKSGIAVYSSTAREAFRAAGATVAGDGPIVKLPRGLVEDAIDSNPSSITLHSRDGRCDVRLEDSRVHYGTGGTAIYVLDPDDHRRRPSTLEDVALNARLVDRLDHIHLFTINVFPNEIKEQDDIDVNRFYHSLKHTTKHVMGGVYSMAGCRRAVALAEEIAGGAGPLAEKPFVSFITLIISPFKIDGNYGEITCYLAGKNLPVVVPTEPICGTTSPITLAGNVLTHFAETLAGITLVQCVRKGAPGICGSVGSTCNLKTMDHLGGPIERAMINAAVAQLAQRLAIPLYSTAGTTDAKSVDVQAAWESAMSNLLVAMSGANYIHDAAGLMEADLTVSYEKLVIDNEVLGMCQRVLRGIEVSDETLAADLITARGPGADFLAEEHTVRHMRNEFFEPELADRSKRTETAGDDALARARAFVETVRREKAPGLLGAKLEARLEKLFPELRA